MQLYTAVLQYSNCRLRSLQS